MAPAVSNKHPHPRLSFVHLAKPHARRGALPGGIVDCRHSAKSPSEGDAACASGDVLSVSLLAVGEADGLTSRSASGLSKSTVILL